MSETQPAAIIEALPDRPRIYPVAMSGGAGSRLWPLSREALPKQFLPLTESRTLMQGTAARTADATRFAPLTVIANADHGLIISDQLCAVGIDNARLVLEPFGRNTAAAAAIAALIARREDEDALVLLMPADHRIGDVEAFHAAIETGAVAARNGAFVLFGIRPQSPATGYGYIESGEALANASGVHKVGRFVEKPDLATAEGYLAAGTFSWNSGIFLLPAAAFLDEMAVLAPDILAAATSALDGSTTIGDSLYLDADSFAACPSISIDYAIMEKTTRAAVVPVDMSWTDVGSWSALWDIGGKDGADNVLHGDVVAEDASGSYLRSEGIALGAAGISDLIVVATPDAVLVVNKSRDQDVKRIVERLKKDGHPVATQTPLVRHPWGTSRTLHKDATGEMLLHQVAPGQMMPARDFGGTARWIVAGHDAVVVRDQGDLFVADGAAVLVSTSNTRGLRNDGNLPLTVSEVVMIPVPAIFDNDGDDEATPAETAGAGAPLEEAGAA